MSHLKHATHTASVMIGNALVYSKNVYLFYVAWWKLYHIILETLYLFSFLNNISGSFSHINKDSVYFLNSHKYTYCHGPVEE